MEENFVKGMLYKEIYRNEINSYIVGLFKVKESTFSEFEEGDVINITGTLPRLSDNNIPIKRSISHRRKNSGKNSKYSKRRCHKQNTRRQILPRRNTKTNRQKNRQNI